MTHDEMKEELLKQLTELDVRLAALRALVDGWHPPAQSSPAWTEMPPSSFLRMANGDVVTISAAGALLLNDAPMGSTTKVTLAYIDDHDAIRHHSADAPQYWWLWTGTGWTATPDTRPTAPPPVTDTHIKPRILTWLKTLPRNKFISAQMAHADFREYDAMVAQLDVKPGLVGVDPWLDQWGSPPYFIYDTKFIDRCKRHWDEGGLVQMSAMFPNPAGNSGYGPPGNPTEILKRGSAQNVALYKLFDQAAAPLRAFRDHGMAVLFRPYFEMDGTWFWWCRPSFNAVQYNELWRMTHRYMTVDLGLDNLLWVFAVNGGPQAYNFVGEDVVDICGIDGYTDTPDSQAYTNLYNRLRSEAPNLLVSWTEFGSGTP